MEKKNYSVVSPFLLCIIFLNITFLNVNAQLQLTQLVPDSTCYVSSISTFGSDTIYYAKGSKIYKSYDRGLTWDSVETSGSNIFRINFLNSQDGVIIKPQGIYKTHDAGLTWDTLTNGLNASYGDCHMINPNHVIATNFASTIRHLDNGLIYDDTLKDPLAPGWPLYIYDFDFINRKDGFGAGAVAGATALIHTSDSGHTWDVRATGGYLYLLVSEVSFMDTLTGWAVEDGPSMGTKIAYTNDGGYTWFDGYSFFHDLKMYSVDFNESGFGLVQASTSWLLFSTDDGGVTWDTAYNPMISGQPYFHKVKIANDTLAYAGGLGGFYKLSRTLSSLSDMETTNETMQIFPNPTDALVSIYYPIFEGNTFELSVYNSIGNLITTCTVSQSAYTLDLTKHGSGFYFVKATSGSNVQVQKIVVR